MRLLRMTDRDADQRWDSYVGPLTSTVTDLTGWRRVAREAYRLKPHFVAVEDDSRLTGALSLYEIRHPIFGHYLATAPFGNDGGLHFDRTETRDVLLAEAKRTADRLDVDYLVIRCRGLELDGFAVDKRYVTAVIDLSDGKQGVWQSILPAKTRNQIRKGLKQDFSLRVGHEQMMAFYRVFHAHMRDLGSPAHSLAYYRAVLKHLGDKGEFYVVRDGDRPIAGALLFVHNGTAMNYHTVTRKEYGPSCANYLIYWKMIEASCAQGCSRFDMGRSELTSPVLRFKKNWRPQIVPLVYNYYLRKLKEIPFVDHNNPRYRLPIAVWKRLPVSVTKLLGPHLIRGLA